jgi:hypothetical protein
MSDKPDEPTEDPAHLDPTGVDEAPHLVLELAASAFRMVKQTLKIDLDFTPDTLPLLDHHLQGARAEAAKSADLGELLATSAGGYFGEVVRRHLPFARWHVDESDFTRWRIEFGHVFLHFNPVGVALEVLRGEDAEGWQAHLEVLPSDKSLLEQALARMGEISEDDYYTLSVRFEVLAQVVAALEGAQVARGEVGRRFPREVYRATTGEDPGGPIS